MAEKTFKNKRIRFIRIADFKKKLKFAKENYIIRLCAPDSSIKCRAFLEEKKETFLLTMYDYVDGEWGAVTYKARKDDKEQLQQIDPKLAFSTFNKYYKVPRIYDDKFQAPFSATGVQFFNPKFNKQRTQNCIGYDLNSAYTWSLLSADLPDTTKVYESGVVKNDEIGFDGDGNIMKAGQYAVFRFKRLNKADRELIQKFAHIWYQKKKNARSAQEKAKAKEILNMSIGYLQHYNCFLRSAVINYCNDFINSIINKYPDNVLFANTDSIVANISILEIESNLGDEIGQWKVEHQGSFYYNDFNYQWNFETASTKGIPTSYQKKGFDLEKDDPRENHCAKYYEMDYNKIEIKEVDYSGEINTATKVL